MAPPELDCPSLLRHPYNGFPSIGSNALAQLDDDALTGGIAGGIGDDPNVVNTTGILVHDYGSDGAGTTLLTADGAVLPAALPPLSTRRVRSSQSIRSAPTSTCCRSR